MRENGSQSLVPLARCCSLFLLTHVRVTRSTPVLHLSPISMKGSACGLEWNPHYLRGIIISLYKWPWLDWCDDALLILLKLRTLEFITSLSSCGLSTLFAFLLPLCVFSLLRSNPRLWTLCSPMESTG